MENLLDQHSQKIIEKINSSQQAKQSFVPFFFNLVKKDISLDINTSNHTNILTTINSQVDNIKSNLHNYINDNGLNILAKLIHAHKSKPLATFTTVAEISVIARNLIDYYCHDYRFLGFEDNSWNFHDHTSQTINTRDAIIYSNTVSGNNIIFTNYISELLVSIIQKYIGNPNINVYSKTKNTGTFGIKYVFIVIE